MLSCIDENSRYFVLASLKLNCSLRPNLTQFVGLILTFQYNFVGFLTCNVGITWYHLRIVENTALMSTMYKLKSTGPNMQPCGTPKLLSWVDEVLSSICTYCRRYEM